MSELATVAQSLHWSLRPGINDLATVRPDLVVEWHPTKNGDKLPSETQEFSKKSVWWVGSKCGHEWEAPPARRKNKVGSAGCPFCCGKKVLIGFNDLASKFPESLFIWDYEKNIKFTPESVSAHSAKKAWWKCAIGHTWYEAVYDQARRKGTCPFCINARVWAGFNDLATTHPIFSGEWHPKLNGILLPTQVTAGSSSRVWWQCTKGHEWTTLITGRVSGKTGCPICSGQQLLVGFNDLATTNPKLAEQWHPTKNGNLKPTDISAGHNKNAWWMDKYGHEWRAVINSRHQNSSGCPVCIGRKILIGFNDLGTTNLILTSQWHPTKNEIETPQSVTQWSGKKAWWLGDCGHEWEATIASRTNGNDCQRCVKIASKIETAIYEAIRLTIPDIKQSQTLPVWWTKGHNASVDMLIESEKIVIEYDGSFWHKRKVDKDTTKSSALLNAGYTVIRIRHQPLPSLAITHSNYHEVAHVSQSIDELAAEVITLINQ